MAFVRRSLTLVLHPCWSRPHHGASSNARKQLQRPSEAGTCAYSPILKVPTYSIVRVRYVFLLDLTFTSSYAVPIRTRYRTLAQSITPRPHTVLYIQRERHRTRTPTIN